MRKEKAMANKIIIQNAFKVFEIILALENIGHKV